MSLEIEDSRRFRHRTISFPNILLFSCTNCFHHCEKRHFTGDSQTARSHSPRNTLSVHTYPHPWRHKVDILDTPVRTQGLSFRIRFSSITCQPCLPTDPLGPSAPYGKICRSILLDSVLICFPQMLPWIAESDIVCTQFRHRYPSHSRSC